MGAKHGPQQSSSALALMHLTCGHYARFWGYHTPAMWQMWKSEQPPDAVLSPTWSVTDVCGSLDILPTAHQKRTTTVLSLRWSGAASRLEATVRKTQPHLALGSGGRPWPTEHWPCICLEEGSYSWRLAAHCRHCNAPAEYAIKEEQEDEQADKTPNLAELGLPSHLTHM